MTTSHNLSLVIASTSKATKDSLECLCASIAVPSTDRADIWLVDGHHPPSHIPKDARVIVLGPIPKDMTPIATIPTPVTLISLKEALQKHLSTSQVSLRNQWVFDAQQRCLLHPKESTINLTEKEASLLQYLLQHSPNEVSSKQLLKEIWSVDKDVDTHTVETHIYRLRQKAGEAPFDLVTSEQGYKVKYE